MDTVSWYVYDDSGQLICIFLYNCTFFRINMITLVNVLFLLLLYKILN